MKTILKGLTVLVICGVLNFGLTTNAQAKELISMSGTEFQEVSRHHHYRPPPHDYGPPPRAGAWGHRYPSPHYGDYGRRSRAEHRMPSLPMPPPRRR